MADIDSKIIRILRDHKLSLEEVKEHLILMEDGELDMLFDASIELHLAIKEHRDERKRGSEMMPRSTEGLSELRSIIRNN